MKVFVNVTARLEIEVTNIEKIHDVVQEICSEMDYSFKYQSPTATIIKTEILDSDIINIGS